MNLLVQKTFEAPVQESSVSQVYCTAFFVKQILNAVLNPVKSRKINMNYELKT